MSTPLRVLIIEDSEDDAALLLRELQRGGYDPTWARVETAEALQAALARQTWDLVLSDYSMPHFHAPAALALLQASGLDLPFIIVSGAIGEDTAVAAMKAGAHDYLMKGNLARLVPAVDRELREAEVRRERRWAEEALQQREEQLRQAQKMEAVGRLVAGVAHNFNNLLTVISSCSELLLLRVGADHALRRYTEEIKQAANQGGALTRQLLTFSRRQDVQLKMVDCNAVVTSMEEMLRHLIGEDIDLQIVLDPALGCVKADQSQIEQVIMNLVVNARDAMPQGGRLTLETTHLGIDEAYTPGFRDVPPGRYVLLVVRDTGCGMDAETQSHLFEPFFTTKEPGQGTGLGLSMVYGIVTQSGGQITVASAPGQGTTFTVYLPWIEDPAMADTPGPPHSGPASGTETILLVEDERAVRELVRTVLLATGYTVLTASHGNEALLLWERHQGPIHLLLTDVIMPGMSGPELAQRLGASCPNMKVLYMSGYTNEAIIPHGIGDVDRVLLRKPFIPQHLARKVREVLDADVTP